MLKDVYGSLAFLFEVREFKGVRNAAVPFPVRSMVTSLSVSEAESVPRDSVGRHLIPNLTHSSAQVPPRFRRATSQRFTESWLASFSSLR